MCAVKNRLVGHKSNYKHETTSETAQWLTFNLHVVLCTVFILLQLIHWTRSPAVAEIADRTVFIYRVESWGLTKYSTITLLNHIHISRTINNSYCSRKIFGGFSFRAQGQCKGGWKLYHCVPWRAVPINLFRYFCCRMYYLTTMQSITDRWSAKTSSQTI